MLVGFEHVGMTVSNLDRSIEFYELLGLRLRLRKRQPNGGEVAFMDAGGGQLEMGQPPGTVVTPARRPVKGEAGMAHLTLAVDDVDADYRALTEAGVVGMEAPRAAHNSEILSKVAFVLDPDGIVIELAERRAP
ncbi:MAG: VOC family protein [Devosia nanyangense]|uniref:VOC family protein n=1 Tax=Devosia nanyangense TaxID=1228055 RepID=A0A933L1D9_9HYPH|nr:VOC family protein [Devosia nanyangense]